MKRFAALLTSLAGLICGCGGGAGSDLGLTIYTNGVQAGQTFELRLFGGGATCPATLNLQTAQALLIQPVCTGAPNANCTIRKQSLAAGQSGTLKDIPIGAIVILVTSPAGDAPNSGGCATATVTAGQFASATVTLATF